MWHNIYTGDTMSNAGAPTKLSYTMIEDMASYAERDPFPEYISAMLGISTRTFFRWIRKGADECIKRDRGCPPNKRYEVYYCFFSRYRAAKAVHHADHVSIIRDHAKNDWKAATWILKRLDPDGMIERAKTNIDLERQSELFVIAMGKVLTEQQVDDVMDEFKSLIDAESVILSEDSPSNDKTEATVH
jgi:hypothetical protein